MSVTMATATATHFRLRSRSLLSLYRLSASALAPSPLSSAYSRSLPRFSFGFIDRLSAPPSASAGRCFSTRSTSSSLNDPNPNWSNRPPKETILLDGCDFEHWLVVMEKPEGDPTRDEIIDRYIKTLAKIVGSEEEARMKIYSVSTRCYFAFGALVSEEDSYKLKELEGVRWVLPDSYLDVRNKDYGGEPFINGNAVPYDPKYHEEWIRNNARANERNRRNDRPRHFDRSRNFDRRRENMQQQQNAPPFNQSGSPPPNNMPSNANYQSGPPNPNYQSGPPNANYQSGPPNPNYQSGPPNANYPNQGHQNQQGFQGGYQNQYQGPQNPGYGDGPPNQGYRGGHPGMNYQSHNMGQGMSPPGGMPPQQHNIRGLPPPDIQEWNNNPQAQPGFQDPGFNPSRDPGSVPASSSF